MSGSSKGHSTRRGRLLCALGFHRMRDERGWEMPDWYAISRPIRYECTRGCGYVSVLDPPAASGHKDSSEGGAR